MTTRVRPVYAEHDLEPIPGLPATLPAGESVLWQGRPRWTGIARRALFVRWIAAYFALIALWRGAELAAGGAGAGEVALGALLPLGIGLVPIAILLVFAWAAQRSTIYTVTNRRVVMRVGVALPMTVNLPFALIESAGLARHADGTGDIVLNIARPHRASWIALWPHVRTWRVSRPEPMLRALRDAESAAQVLSRALAAHAEVPVQPVPEAETGRAAVARPGAAAVA